MSPELPFALLAGAVLGASAHRAGLCTVKAVAEVMTSRSGHILWSFLKASLWSTGLLALASWLGAEATPGHRAVSGIGLLGGLLFGMGAGWNGACSFSTLSRLADGHLVMFFTLAGWAAAMCIVAAQWPGLHDPLLRHDPGAWWAVPLSLWMVWEAFGMWRRRRGALEGLRAGYWTLSVAVLLIAIANVVLVLLGRPWSFTATALCATGAAPTPPCSKSGVLWMISGVAVLTMVVSASARGTFRLRLPRGRAVARHFGAGLVMGTGASLIPGGNDGLILFGLPSLSPHALPSWGMLLVGIWLALALMRLAGGRVPQIRCDADICKSVM